MMQTTEGYILTTGQPTGLPEDLVAEVAAVFEWYGCDQGSLTSDAAARAILAARAWQKRREAGEREHTRRRENAERLADLGRVMARTRAHIARSRA